MQDQETRAATAAVISTSSPELLVTVPNDDEGSGEINGIKQIDCQVGSGGGGGDGIVNGECDKIGKSKIEDSPTSTGTKTKRKAKSTRRRLNAMINNASIHFSDTDSEGELTVARVSTPNHMPKLPKPEGDKNNLLQPVISVTLDGSDDSSYGGGRRNSYLENVTDVDEIYTSEPENDLCERRKSRAAACASPRGSLAVAENPHQGETDLEDMSNDDEEAVMQPLILLKSRSDILCDFNGETITTKEGDGPFSIEVRNQMSIDETKLSDDTPDILILPTTDSEDMEASDDEEEVEGACGRSESFQDFDALDRASQIFMKNVSKMEQLLTVNRDADDGSISDSHTDVEDIE